MSLPDEAHYTKNCRLDVLESIFQVLKRNLAMFSKSEIWNHFH